MGVTQSMCRDLGQLINLNVFDFPHLRFLVLDVAPEKQAPSTNWGCVSTDVHF